MTPKSYFHFKKINFQVIFLYYRKILNFVSKFLKYDTQFALRPHWKKNLKPDKNCAMLFISFYYFFSSKIKVSLNLKSLFQIKIFRIFFQTNCLLKCIQKKTYLKVCSFYSEVFSFSAYKIV